MSLPPPPWSRVACRRRREVFGPSLLIAACDLVLLTGHPGTRARASAVGIGYDGGLLDVESETDSRPDPAHVLGMLRKRSERPWSHSGGMRAPDEDAVHRTRGSTLMRRAAVEQDSKSPSRERHHLAPVAPPESRPTVELLAGTEAPQTTEGGMVDRVVDKVAEMVRELGLFGRDVRKSLETVDGAMTRFRIEARQGNEEGSSTTTTAEGDVAKEEVSGGDVAKEGASDGEAATTALPTKTAAPAVTTVPATTTATTTMGAASTAGSVISTTTTAEMVQCQDSNVTGLWFNNGEKAWCGDLSSYCGDTVFGEQIKKTCPKTCGLCQIEATMDCFDREATDAPIYIFEKKATECRDLSAFCSSAEDIRTKCQATCGVCSPPPR